MIHLIQHPSYTKIMPNTIRPKEPYTSDLMADAEEFGYQVVVYTDSFEGEAAKFELSFDGEYQVYLEKYVDVKRPHYDDDTKSYLLDRPGAMPDCLIPITSDDVFFINRNYIVLWVSISTGTLGEVQSVLKISTKSESASCELNLKVVQLNKVPQFFGHGEFIDPTFIAKDHGVKIFSDRFFEIAKRYFKLAVEHNINEILVPLFTPEYPNYPTEGLIQMVKIKQLEGDFRFEYDFEIFDRWINTAYEAGIRRITLPVFLPDYDYPYGAKFIVEIDGEEQIIFEDETVLDHSYSVFIRRFLRDLVKHLDTFHKRIFSFHFSVAPQVWNEKTYREFRKHFYDYASKFRVTDYDVEYRYYKRGTVGSPIAHLHDVFPYSEATIVKLNGCFDISNAKDMINPFIASSSLRLRCLGVFGYRYELGRFFNLGFNAHDVNNQFPSGSLSLVYPEGDQVYPSIRLKQLKYAVQDYRLLESLHYRYSPNRMNGLIEQYVLKQDRYLDDPVRYQKFRAEIFALMENLIKYCNHIFI